MNVRIKRLWILLLLLLTRLVEMCVTAAGAIEIKNIPPHSNVVGNPARIVKQYNFETQKRKKVK